MRIIRLKYLLLIAPLLSIASCSTIYTSTSTKSLSATSERLIQAPLVAELDVETTQKVKGEKTLTKKEIKKRTYKEEEVKSMVIATALDRNDGDVMIEPRFTTTYDKKGRLSSMSVSGYAANYESFRSFSLQDTILLDAIYGRERVVAPYSVGGGSSSATNRSNKLLSAITNEKPLRSKKSSFYGSGIVISPSLVLGEYCVPFEISVGYQVKHVLMGMYLNSGQIACNCYMAEKTKHTNYGVFVHYNILNKKVSPYLRGQLGFKNGEHRSEYDSRSPIADCAGEVGVQYRPKGRSALSAGFAMRRYGYEDYLNGHWYLQTDPAPAFVIRYSLVLGGR